MTKLDNKWTISKENYADLVKDESKDSAFLRKHGLQHNIIELIGDVSRSVILDVGCGNGWIVGAVHPGDGRECDIARSPDLPEGRNFLETDITNPLPYTENRFDVTVASLVLMWVDNIDHVLNEMHRVTKSGGKVIIAIMHPTFYKTGDLDGNENFVVESDLSKPFVINEHMINDSVGPFTYHYRSLNNYINATISCGLTIEHIRDWYVDISEYRRHFAGKKNTSKKRTGKFPMYTFIKAIKQ